MVKITFKVSPLEAAVLLHNVVQCDDAKNDAERTVEELVRELNTDRGYLSKGIFESALYCCNMEAERGTFWHPLKQTFDQFLKKVIPSDLEFNKFYNVVYEPRAEENKT